MFLLPHTLVALSQDQFNSLKHWNAVFSSICRHTQSELKMCWLITKTPCSRSIRSLTWITSMKHKILLWLTEKYVKIILKSYFCWSCDPTPCPRPLKVVQMFLKNWLKNLQVCPILKIMPCIVILATRQTQLTAWIHKLLIQTTNKKRKGAKEILIHCTYMTLQSSPLHNQPSVAFGVYHANLQKKEFTSPSLPLTLWPLVKVKCNQTGLALWVSVMTSTIPCLKQIGCKCLKPAQCYRGISQYYINKASHLNINCAKQI